MPLAWLFGPPGFAPRLARPRRSAGFRPHGPGVLCIPGGGAARMPSMSHHRSPGSRAGRAAARRPRPPAAAGGSRDPRGPPLRRRRGARGDRQGAADAELLPSLFLAKEAGWKQEARLSFHRLARAKVAHPRKRNPPPRRAPPGFLPTLGLCYFTIPRAAQWSSVKSRRGEAALPSGLRVVFCAGSCPFLSRSAAPFPRSF